MPHAYISPKGIGNNKMIAVLINKVVLKDGSIFEPGKVCCLTPLDDTIAEVEIDGRKLKIRHKSLQKYFDEFPEFNMDDLEAATYDCICPTVTGYDVEPDGHDPEGWPSILLACGLM